MMRTTRSSTVAALVVSLLISQCCSFVPNARHTRSNLGSERHTVSALDDAEEVESIMNMNNFLTPEGTGFSSPISRIVKLSKRGDGCYRANGSDRVVDVMEAITQNADEDVALVYDEETKKLLGIFTERDYIQVVMNE